MRKLTLTALALLAAMSMAADTDKKAPAGLDGFNGTVEGTIATVGENHKAITMKIDKILHKNASSTAANPDAAIGKTVMIYAKSSAGNGEKAAPDSQQVAFIKSLKKGEDLQLDIAEVNGRLQIADLTTAQKDAASHAPAEKEKKK
jgi:hypothetical protein